MKIDEIGGRRQRKGGKRLWIFIFLQKAQAFTLVSLDVAIYKPQRETGSILTCCMHYMRCSLVRLHIDLFYHLKPPL